MSRPTVLPSDREHRRLCHRFLDAIEVGDLDAMAACMSGDVAMWFNVTGQTSGLDEVLAAQTAGASFQRRRTYDDRQVETFDDGFLVRYSLKVVLHDGSSALLWACLLTTVHDGLIVRMDEYLDSTKFVPTGGRTRKAA